MSKYMYVQYVCIYVGIYTGVFVSYICFSACHCVRVASVSTIKYVAEKT